MSIVDTGRFWKILVIPVLQILENTGNTSIADTGRLGMSRPAASYYPKFLLIPSNLQKYDLLIFKSWNF
jgi:hypothetical protein